jgi:hypothetical protein
MMLFMMRETLGVKNENVREYTISKGKKKLHIVSHTLSRSFWNVFDFVKKLGLGNKGLNVCKEITTSSIFDNEITSMSQP